MLWMAMWAVAPASEAVLERIEAVEPYREARIAQRIPDIPDAAYAKAAEGKVVTGLEDVEGHAAKTAWGIAVLDVPIGRLWSAVNDELHALKYTAIAHSELVSGRPCESGRAVLQVLPVPMVSDRWWITHLTENEALRAQSEGAVRELAWTSSVDPAAVTSETGRSYVASHTPLGFTIGGWFLARIDDERTLLEYALQSDPGGRVPTGMLNWFASGSVTDTLEAMERFAIEGQPSCP